MSVDQWSTTATVMAGCLLLVAYMAAIEGLRVFSRWAVDRQEARDAAATFEADFIPEAPDVADQEKALLEAGLVAGLEQVEAAWAEHCRAVRRESA